MRLTSLLSITIVIGSPAWSDDSVDQLAANAMAIYRNCVVSEAVRLDDGRETATTLASAGLAACAPARGQMSEILTNVLVRKTPQLPRTTENRTAAVGVASEQMAKVDEYAKERAVWEVLERQSGKRK